MITLLFRSFLASFLAVPLTIFPRSLINISARFKESSGNKFPLTGNSADKKSAATDDKQSSRQLCEVDSQDGQMKAG